jgi:hypothetical protein
MRSVRDRWRFLETTACARLEFLAIAAAESGATIGSIRSFAREKIPSVSRISSERRLLHSSFIWITTDTHLICLFRLQVQIPLQSVNRKSRRLTWLFNATHSILDQAGR